MAVSTKSLNITHLTKGQKVTRLQFSALQYAMNLAKAIGEEIPGLLVTSGYRDIAAQQKLYNLYLAGKGNIAAKPGQSWHHYISEAEGICRGAIDFDHAKLSPDQLQDAIVAALKKHEIKFHTCLMAG